MLIGLKSNFDFVVNRYDLKIKQLQDLMKMDTHLATVGQTFTINPVENTQVNIKLRNAVENLSSDFEDITEDILSDLDTTSTDFIDGEGLSEIKEIDNVKAATILSSNLFKIDQDITLISKIIEYVPKPQNNFPSSFEY